MARKLRLEYPGAIYHVMNRGNHREAIVRDDEDRGRFMATLGEACTKTGWQAHACCLLGNHFHLVVETPQPNLVAGMKWLLGTYTCRFNRRHRLSGHLFGGRYKALVVDGSGNGYLRLVCDYVHLNPVRARLLQAQEPLRTYRWSSWPEYLKPASQRWPWLRVDRLLGEYGVEQDTPAGRRHLEQRVEERRRSESEADYRAIRRGWCLGRASFRSELLEQVEQWLGPEHYGEQRSESALEKAERVVREELRRRDWREIDLETRKKGDKVKVEIAVRLRAETLVTMKWIAERLHMGTLAHANDRMYRWRRGHGGA